MKTPRDKYQSDSNFKLLVDMMVAQIQECNYTPSEMREAAMLASVIYEECRLNFNPIIVNKKMEIALREVHDWISKDPSNLRLEKHG